MKPIVDPYTLLEQPNPLPEHWALVDAFDAVTNGMDNPEALKRLEHITDSELLNWKWLVIAIKAIYESNKRAVQEALQHIANNSPPGVLKPLFETWLSEGTGRSYKALPNAALANVYSQLRRTQHPLALRADQAAEAIRQGVVYLFEQHFEKILYEMHHHLGADGPALAMRYGIDSLCTLHDEGYRMEDFLALLISTLGQADGCCCLALALLKKEDKEPHFRSRIIQAIDASLAATDGKFVTPSMKNALKSIKTRLNAEPASNRQTKKTVQLVQLELF